MSQMALLLLKNYTMSGVSGSISLSVFEFTARETMEPDP